LAQRGQADRNLTPEQVEQIPNAVNINNSDIDSCTYQGQVIVNYSWGNQHGVEPLAKATFEGTLNLGLFASGATHSELLDTYPHLTIEGITKALQYAATQTTIPDRRVLVGPTPFGPSVHPCVRGWSVEGASAVGDVAGLGESSPSNAPP
jgi:hypothetical protein